MSCKGTLEEPSLKLVFARRLCVQGTLTEGEGSVQLTSTLGYLVFYKSKECLSWTAVFALSKTADLIMLVQGGQLY
jgi:hypothetical protein